MFKSIIAVLTVATAPLAAQEPELPARARSTAGFVPAGYRVLKDVAGFLDGDEYRDVILLIEADRQASDSVGPAARPRILMVLSGGADGLTRVVTTAAAVLAKPADATTDPLEELTLDRSAIVIRHAGPASGSTITHRFRFLNGTYRLVGRTIRTIDRSNYCPRLKEFRPTSFEDQNLLARTVYRYRIPEDRCVKLERRSRLPRTVIDLPGFDIRAEVDRLSGR